MRNHFRNSNKEKRKTMCKKVASEIRKNEYDINTISSASSLILNEYSFEGAVPIVKIINDAGFKTFVQELPDGLGGYIIISNDIEERFGTDKIIVINKRENTNRQRFSLAHEFGHYLIDPDARNSAEYYNAFESDDNKTKLEKLIDRFAAELLMPAEKFKIEYDRIKNQYSDLYDQFKALADYFKVPSVAVQKRFSEVGIEL